MLNNREVLLAEIETTYNVDPSPVAADAILVENLSWALAGSRMNERPAIRASLGSLKHIFGGTLLEIKFDVELKGSGAAGTPPEIGPLLRACGMEETIVVATSVAYKPRSTLLDSITFYYNQDGHQYIVTGCRGTVSGNLEVGAYGKMSFTFTGHFSGPTQVALPTPVYDTTVPPPIIAGAFTIGGYAGCVSKIAFDLANAVAMPACINASDGYGEIQITKRDVNGSFDPEAVLLATKNYFNEFIAGTVQAMTTGPIGATAGNRWNISFPAIAYREIAPADKEGIRTYDIGFGAAETVADNDEISILFT